MEEIVAVVVAILFLYAACWYFWKNNKHRGF